MRRGFVAFTTFFAMACSGPPVAPSPVGGTVVPPALTTTALASGQPTERVISAADPVCSPEGVRSEYGGPCQAYVINSHARGRVQFTLLWASPDARFVFYVLGTSPRVQSTSADRSPFVTTYDVATDDPVTFVVQLQSSPSVESADYKLVAEYGTAGH